MKYLCPTSPLRALLLLPIVTPALLCGQTVQATSPEEPKAADLVELSVFNVDTTRDTGYLAGESLVGGRISTELLKTPADVTVLTKDFLNDIGATSYLEAAAYLPNATVAPLAANNSADYGSQVSFRGLPGGYPARNYFRNFNSVDFYIVERLEGARGPNAILFGDGVLGGVLNSTTKRAQIKRAITTVGARFDSEGSVRGTIDVNRSLTDKLAMRVNLLASDERTWIDRTFNERLGAHLAVTYRPWKNGEFRTELEHGNIEALYTPQSYTDNVSQWNGVGYTAPLTAGVPAGSSGTARFTTPRLTYSPTLGLVNLQGLGQTIGSGLAIEPSKQGIVPNFPSLPRDFSLQPPNAFTDIQYVVAAAFYEHRWTDRILSEVAFQYANQQRAQQNAFFGSYTVDPNRVLPDGSPNPHFGEGYTEASPSFTNNDNEHIDYRFVTSYELPISLWTQRLNLIATRRIEIFDSQRDIVGRINGTNPDPRNGANLYTQRFYVTEGAQDIVLPKDDATYQWRIQRDGDSRQDQTLDSVQLATVAQFWRDRITFIGGVRRDFYESDQRAASPTRSTDGRIISFTQTPLETNVTKLSGGVTVFPIRQVGAYLNYSESFNPVPSGAPGLYEEAYGPTEGAGYSGGLRFNLFDGKVVASAGYYNSEEAGRIVGGGATSVTELNRIWTNVNLAERRVLAGYRDTQDLEGEGYEFDVVANPTRSLRLRGNISFPETTQLNTIPSFRRYYAENLPVWNAALTNPATQNINQVRADLLVLQARLENAAEGRVLNGTPDYTASLFGNYTFRQGWLNRFGFGGGATVVGRTVIGNEFNQPLAYLEASERYLLNAQASYSFKIKKRGVSVQLNVSNLLDEDEVIYNGVTTRAAFGGSATQNFRSSFYYPDPRKFILTVSVEL